MIETEADLDDLFTEWEKPGSPGFSVAVYRAGEVAYARGVGMADLERSGALTPQSVFDIGSTSKQFTAACILLLARDGALGLDDDIRRHLPALPDLGGPVTVRHLVHHTSGWRDYLNLTLLAGRSLDNDYEEAEVIELLAAQRALDFPPGTKHSYSNSGYFLLSEIVRVVSGQTLRQFAEEHIFGPLGMERTFFHDDRGELVPNRALAYAPGESGFRIDLSIWDVTGDGAVFTTVEDLAAWDRQFYDCTLPGGDEFIAQLTTPGRLNDGTRLDYAFGLSIGTYRGARTISHGGSWGGYRAELIRFPDLRTSVAVLANLATIDAGGLARKVAERLLEGRLQPATPEEDLPDGEGPADAFIGTFVDDDRTFATTVEREGDGTVARLAGQAFPLLLIAPGRARLRGLPVELRLSGEDVELLIRGDDRWTLRRTPAGPIDAGRLVGRYRSDELNAVYEISAGSEGLELRRGHQPPEPLLGVTDAVLSSAHGVLAFDETAGGFQMGTPRARGIRFDRF